MKARWLLTFLCFLLASVASAQNVPNAVDFEWGARPARAVFDPDGLIDSQLAKDISRGLAEVLANETIDIIIVVMKDLGNMPPEYIAKRFREAWKKSPLQCVVVFVPGKLLKICPADYVVEFHNPDDIAFVIAESEGKIAKLADDQQKIKLAGSETVALMRYWISTVVIMSNNLREQQAVAKYFRDRREKRMNYLFLFCIATLIPTISIIWILVVYLRSLRPVYFPRHRVTSRLGAPYAGGSGAVVDLNVKIP